MAVQSVTRTITTSGGAGTSSGSAAFLSSPPASCSLSSWITAPGNRGYLRCDDL